MITVDQKQNRTRAAWHMPPIDMLFARRRISGTALLAAGLKAQGDVRGMIEPYWG